MLNEVSSITGEGGGPESRAGNPVRVRDCAGSYYSNHGYRLAMEQRVLMIKASQNCVTDTLSA